MSDAVDLLLTKLRESFPGFTTACKVSRKSRLEEILPGMSAEEIAGLERRLGLPLPASYRALLLKTRGFWLFGGAVQLGRQHPFVHRFPKLDDLNPRQREVVAWKGGAWPPPSEGMLCFAEYFRDADGDQVLFDVSNGLIGGEYPVVYYSHETRPPFVQPVASSFQEWLDEKCVQDITAK